MRHTDAVWEDTGSGATIRAVGTTLAVRNSALAHEKVENLLELLRQAEQPAQQAAGKTDKAAAAASTKVQPGWVDLDSSSSARIETILRQQTKPMKVTSLKQLAAYIEKNHQLQTVIDYRALEDEGLTANDIELQTGVQYPMQLKRR